MKAIFIQYKREYTFIQLKNILFIEKQADKKIIIHTLDNKTYYTYETLRNFELRLEKNTNFIRCHKSFIINMINVKKVSYWVNGTYVVEFVGSNKTALASYKFYKTLLANLDSTCHIL